MILYQSHIRPSFLKTQCHHIYMTFHELKIWDRSILRSDKRSILRSKNTSFNVEVNFDRSILVVVPTAYVDDFSALFCRFISKNALFSLNWVKKREIWAQIQRWTCDG